MKLFTLNDKCSIVKLLNVTLQLRLKVNPSFYSLTTFFLPIFFNSHSIILISI